MAGRTGRRKSPKNPYLEKIRRVSFEELATEKPTNRKRKNLWRTNLEGAKELPRQLKVGPVYFQGRHGRRKKEGRDSPGAKFNIKRQAPKRKSVTLDQKTT